MPMSTLMTRPTAIDHTTFPVIARSRNHRGVWSLIATQFQGAFSDNILRNLLLSIILGMNLAKPDRETFVSVVTFLFSLPFLILSMPGGCLAARSSKRQVTIVTYVLVFGSR